ncbi:hypothetical protein OUZ56_019032 [Daphnia magna]|uniref:Uncharacterized protein n=1 Tax=Daphnia magna TaxID=35525 RepID=A0ABQ9ZAF6_9CRUS|nr:hypothetical protein OUZ56_019032 [Daphnia magna]
MFKLGKQVPFKKFPGKITAFLEIKFFVLYQHRGPERKNTPGRNSALATQHPILVYRQLDLGRRGEPYRLLGGQ